MALDQPTIIICVAIGCATIAYVARKAAELRCTHEWEWLKRDVAVYSEFCKDTPCNFLSQARCKKCGISKKYKV